MTRSCAAHAGSNTSDEDTAGTAAVEHVTGPVQKFCMNPDRPTCLLSSPTQCTDALAGEVASYNGRHWLQQLSHHFTLHCSACSTFDTSGNPDQESTGGNDMGEKHNNLKENLNNDCRQRHQKS
jgi:hypothetical protein